MDAKKLKTERQVYNAYNPRTISTIPNTDMKSVNKPSTSNVKNPTTNSTPLTIPNWDSNEIDRRLEEQTKCLIEWEELINRTCK